MTWLTLRIAARCCSRSMNSSASGRVTPARIPALRTIVDPPCDTTGTLSIWAQTRGHALLSETERAGLINRVTQGYCVSATECTWCGDCCHSWPAHIAAVWSVAKAGPGASSSRARAPTSHLPVLLVMAIGFTSSAI
ncbi:MULTISPECIES: hypothetical protein [unclassified Polaromonas]|uniref:hypothetical protein n=1 Tax=unclassified Polaromonas TaxID=2638319 RepID=UPI0018CAC18B|nr:MULTISPECIES: hypothetical protein [unclassified Polaromonas]MBG6072183.1 hypothetical protein [Polaromonas sp. CG_9.7]MBG6114386.1 hypothetical protein [Polaromonas sp. CG_9.2]MDH6182655.1 hypothetical protein [Polaromonas sp. CG_23.6]